MTEERATTNGMPEGMAHLTFVLLVRPAEAPDLPEADLAVIQTGHLAHLAAMAERGALLAAGPFRRQEDERFRGMCLYRTSVEETRRLARADPAVVAGRLEPLVFQWWFRISELRHAADQVAPD